MSGHVALLGDSIFDNASYVAGGTSVIEHLRRRLPEEFRATLLAVDGSRVSNVADQIDALPSDVTHLVLSIGGNDARYSAPELFTQAPSPMAESLDRVAKVVGQFAHEHHELLVSLKQCEKPLTVCTIYDSIPGPSAAERIGLSVFNDAITRNSFRVGASLIDLRLVCDLPHDYGKDFPIEPFAQGGEKIAQAIADTITQTGSPRRVVV